MSTSPFFVFCSKNSTDHFSPFTFVQFSKLSIASKIRFVKPISSAFLNFPKISLRFLNVRGIIQASHIAKGRERIWILSLILSQIESGSH